MRLFFTLAMLMACFAAPAAAQAPVATAQVQPVAQPAPAETVGMPTADPALAEPLGRDTNDIPIMPYLLQLLAITGVVAGLAFFSIKLLKDKAPGLGLGLASGKQVKVVDKVVVDPKRMVFVVNVGNRYWLLAATESQVTPVAELSKQDLGGDFAQLLEQEKVRGEKL